MTKHIRRRMVPLLAALAVWFAALPLPAYADVPYWTNYIDKKGRNLGSQPAYMPVGTIGADLVAEDGTGKSFFSPLQNPKDIFVAGNDHLYVADTGNNRIVEFDANGMWRRYITVPESPLNKPEGVFIHRDGDIYIADTGNKRIVRLNAEGKLVKAFPRPVSAYIPASFQYDPVRVVVDKRGFLYIVVLGGYQGLLQLDPNGGFQSFYGANKTSFTPLDALKRAFYTKKMYANEASKLPGAISSVAMDKDGFIYTATIGGNTVKNTIKKLNIRGLNMLRSDTEIFGAIRVWERKYESGKLIQPTLADLTVDANGNITAIDTTYRYMNQFDSNGNPLFFWGGPSSTATMQLGLIKTPVAIDANSHNELFILDGQDGVVQRFRLSEFGAKVNAANRLTLQGSYEESEAHWREVLRLNAYFTPAIAGLAKAAYKQGDFERAARLSKQAEDPAGYSKAFWQIRLVWFQERFSSLATAVLLVGLTLLVAGRWTRRARWRAAWRNRIRSSNPIIVQCKHIFYLLKHPIDGFTALRYENKGSYYSAFALLAAAFLSLVLIRLYTGFTFNTTNVRTFNIAMVGLQSGLIWFGWVVSNYLVSSIYQGEGRFKDVFIGSAYTLLPIVLVGLPLALLSNVLTESERSIYAFLDSAMNVWIALLIFWKVQTTHNYSFGETVVNLVLSVAAFATLAALSFVVVGLSSDLKDFLVEVYKEARLR